MTKQIKKNNKFNQHKPLTTLFDSQQTNKKYKNNNFRHDVQDKYKYSMCALNEQTFNTHTHTHTHAHAHTHTHTHTHAHAHAHARARTRTRTRTRTHTHTVGSVVECLTRDRRAAGSSLTGVTALWSLSKTHLS